jgi:hypothetical protein
MSNRPAFRKKQGAKIQTIKEALSAQGGSLWYAPKADLHESHIWLRKAFDTIYEPFLFKSPVVVDQRCNYIIPLQEKDRYLLAGVLCSRLFALALESHGISSLGGGALELPTEKLREIPVFDIRTLTPKERKELFDLSNEMWLNEKPINWGKEKHPGMRGKELDEWILDKMGVAVRTTQLYKDIVEVCRARTLMAERKKTAAKKVVREEVSLVAERIAESVRPLLEGKQFPEAFCQPGKCNLDFDISNHGVLAVDCQPLMGTAILKMEDASTGKIVINRQYPTEVAEVIVNALLLGRRKFSAPQDRVSALAVLNEMRIWLANLIEKIENACQSSALGTRFEQELQERTCRRYPKLT